MVPLGSAEKSGDSLVIVVSADERSFGELTLGKKLVRGSRDSVAIDRGGKDKADVSTDQGLTHAPPYLLLFWTANWALSRSSAGTYLRQVIAAGRSVDHRREGEVPLPWIVTGDEHLV